MAAAETPRHRVRRSTLELVTTDEADARALARRAEALALGPLRLALEQALDRVQTGPDLVEVPRLVFELGPFDPATLEETLPRAFARALPEALGRALPRRDRSAPRSDPDDLRGGAEATEPPSDPRRRGPAERAHALFAALALTGRPPWWHDGPAVRPQPEETTASLIDQALEALAAAMPREQAAALLRRVLANPVARRRLALRLSGPTFASLLDLLAPGLDGVGLADAAEGHFARTAQGFVLGGAGRAALVRETILAAVADGPADAGTLAGQLEVLLASSVGANPAPAGRPVSGPLPTTIDTIEALRAALQDAADALPWVRGLLQLLAEAADRIDGPGEALLALRTLRAEAGRAGEGLDDLSTAALAELLRPFLAAGQPDPARIEASLVPLRPLRPPSQPDHGPAAQAESIAVEDAGLCLLWPFLPAFFERLNLLTPDRRWRTPAAAHRAATLLDHVAHGDAAFRAEEARLPLAKLLSGLSPDAVHEPPGTPLDAAEHQEIEDFLRAMVEHMAPLGRLSVAQLRETWLLRFGLLGQRDGLPLLRVEARGYDVLLDRLPWPRIWVRLPWMPVPLRVEW
jgi:hypothetical protein